MRGGGRGAVVLSLVIGGLLWWGISLKVGNPLLFPSPAETLTALASLLRQESFRLNFAATLARLVVSLFINLLAAAVLAMAAVRSPFLERMMAVPVSLMRSLPILAIILLSLIWLDSRYTVILVTSLIIFPILYLGLLEGARSVSAAYRELARLYHIPAARRIARIYLPGIASHFYTALATAVGLGFKVIVSAEIYSQPPRAIGTLFQKAWVALNTPVLFALSLVVVSLAGAVSLLLSCLYRRSRVGP